LNTVPDRHGRTNRQTDGRTTCRLITALLERSIARQKPKRTYRFFSEPFSSPALVGYIDAPADIVSFTSKLNGWT